MVAVCGGFMAALLAVSVGLVVMHNSQYKNLLYNVTTASEFNQDFKENIDLKMYYYVIESRYSEGLPIQEVQAAQALAINLLDTTSQKDSLRAVTSVLDLCENLEGKIYQIQQTQSYDERQIQLENNVYVLTALIQEYMYNYLYCESVQLNLLQQQISRRLTAEIFLVLALSAVLILLLLQYSIRLSRSVTQPVVDLSRRAEDVIGGDLTVREPVHSETYEIRTLSEGMEQMIARLNAQIQESTRKQASLRKAELALLQAQINPHFLYNTMDTIIWLIEADRPQAAVEMVSNLSDFFRHSLSRGEDVIPPEGGGTARAQLPPDPAGALQGHPGIHDPDRPRPPRSASPQADPPAPGGERPVPRHQAQAGEGLHLHHRPGGGGRRAAPDHRRWRRYDGGAAGGAQSGHREGGAAGLRPGHRP